MTYDEVEPFLGTRCQLRMRCRACRGGHVLSGHVRRGRHAGEVVLKGYTFDIEDIEVIWLPRPPDRPQRRRSVPLLFRRSPLASGGKA
jgi:hypothetical protein